MSADFYAENVGAAAAAAAASTRWLTEEVFKLIDMVQINPAIYNPRHKYYFCRPYVENFWREVDQKLEKNPGASLAKWTNLRISFRREYTNYLEEKVPPCWSYFDRMFFLHPYLRKKQPQSKSLDSQVQDALVQISSLSSRLQRERVAQVAASVVASINDNSSSNNNTSSSSSKPRVATTSASAAGNAQQPMSSASHNYLEYFDEAEHNNSELDEILDDEPHARFQHALHNDIKSECEDNADDFYDADVLPTHDDEELELRSYMLNSVSSSAAEQSKRLQQRMLYLQRLHARAFHDVHEERSAKKRAISEDSVGSSSQQALSSSTTTASMQHVNMPLARAANFTKTATEMVSTTTNNSCRSTLTSNEMDLSSNNSSAVDRIATNMRAQRTDNSNLNATVGAADLCECKTDPDAMFLMSLLPDIQKLNGRDRGKIKIAFQNILQDYLYPD